jgi:hypothetical protein
MESILQNKNIKMSHDIAFYSNMPKVCMVHGKQIKNVAWRKFVQQHVKSMYWFMESILQNTNKKCHLT